MKKNRKTTMPMAVRFERRVGGETIEWRPIEANAGIDIVFIARFIDEEPEYIHCAYFQGGEWFLPYDSDRYDGKTPMLGANELPTHFAPLFASPNVKVRGAALLQRPS